MNVPCKNCIVIGMCKAKLNGGDMMDLMCLSDQCSLLKEFIHPKNKRGDIKLVDQVETYLCANIDYSQEPFNRK